MKSIALLGSTGSIGKQTLDIIAAYPADFRVHTLTAGRNVTLLAEQVRRFRPQRVVVADKAVYPRLKASLNGFAGEIAAGPEALLHAGAADGVDIVLSAIVGFAGLLPTLEAIRHGKAIALANKETLVVAGDIVMAEARKHNVPVLPVDSEHSAIFQCLYGEQAQALEKIILTASGGPFRGKPKDELQGVTVDQALKHPNWNMGAKITIDSASMMNKGLEVIEAKWLFDLAPGQIDVIVHPQSIIHSLVQFHDGSMKAQMGLPDMHLPILLALSFPERVPTDFQRFNFLDYPELNFEPVDTQVFRNLGLAYQALHHGGNMPCALNAANEIAVKAFLDKKLKFLQMPQLIEQTLEKTPFQEKNEIQDYITTDRETRRTAQAILKHSLPGM